MGQFKNKYPAVPTTWLVTVGDLPEFDVDPKGFSMNWRGEGKSLEHPILTSELRCTCRCDDTHDAYLETIGSMGTATIPVTVHKNGVFWWGGVMQGEAIQLQYNAGAGFWFEVVATDGLALLQEIDFDNEGFPYEGFASFLQHISDILKKLPHIQGIWGAGGAGENAFLKSALGWLAVQHASPNDNPLSKSWCNRRVWYDFDSKGNIKNTSCWDVLKNILAIQGARIWQVEGVWFLEQPLIRNENTFPAYVYTYDLAESTTTMSGERSIQCNSSATQRIAPGGADDFLPALREARVSWKARQRRNWLPGYSRKNTGPLVIFDGDSLDHSNALVTLRLTAKLRFKVFPDTYVGTESVWVKFRFRLKVGNYYLRRDVTLQNGVITTSNFNWYGSSGVYFYELSTPLLLSPNVQTTEGTVNIAFTTNTIPAGGSPGNIQFYFEHVGNYKGLTGDAANGVGLEWEFYDTYLEAMVSGRPTNGNAVVEYSSENQDDDLGEVITLETLLADRLDPNDLGGIMAGNNFTPSTFWGDFNGGRTLKLADLWCERMIRFRKRPRRRMNVEFYTGYFPPYYRLNDGVRRWVPMSINYTAAQDVMAGEWLELEKSGEAVSIRDPKGIGIDPTHLNGFPGPGLPPPGGDGGTGGNDERIMPAILWSLAANYTGAPISAGTVTEMQLKYPTEEGVFVEGDRWVVMDPANARNIDVIVEETAEVGDMSVLVSGTAVDTIPAGSMILYPLTNQTIVANGARRWKRWFGAVDGAEIALPSVDYPLPTNHERISVYVEGILYDTEMGNPTYTVDNATNKITFTDTTLSGLNAIVRVA